MTPQTNSGDVTNRDDIITQADAGRGWPRPPRIHGEGPRLADRCEGQIVTALKQAAQAALPNDDVAPQTWGSPAVIGIGDDAAVLPAGLGRTVVTTDSMVLGLDWRDDWSAPSDVGVKVVAQNLADVMAMGAEPYGVVCSIAAEPETRIEWLEHVYAGMASELTRNSAVLLGGDVSGAAAGSVVLTVTALGFLVEDSQPFRRNAALAGEALVVSDPVGRSGAGLTWLLEHANELNSFTPDALATPALADAVAWHRAPRPRPAVQQARTAGVRCAMDVSDGLSTDAARLARASDVNLDLDEGALRRMAEPLRDVVGERAFEHVLASGEEHVLLATCAADAIPASWTRIGTVRDGAGVTMNDRPLPQTGWSHFR